MPEPECVLQEFLSIYRNNALSDDEMLLRLLTELVIAFA